MVNENPPHRMAELVMQRFETLYDEQARLLVRAPGRVNIIGEHTDYNDGFVLPMAIDRAVWIALRPRQDRRVMLYSIDFDDATEIDLDDLRYEGASWREYVKGVAHVLQAEGHDVPGWEGAMAGDVPLGAGLSSSAAVEMATLRAFAAVGGWAWEPVAMAKAGQRAENEWVGMNCGIMDQMISVTGKAGHAVLIDCRTLETQPVPLPKGTVIAILDTATRRGLVGSAYNERRAQCERAAAFFGVSALRDVDSNTFQAQAGDMDPLIARRARHVITENERTVAAAEAMRRGNAAELGRLMNASHASMRDDFEISRKEMDRMVALAQADPSCLGARMTGGGFGGAAVALVKSDQIDQFIDSVTRAYQQATRLEPKVYICTPADGAAVVMRNRS